MTTLRFLDRIVGMVDQCPWATIAGDSVIHEGNHGFPASRIERRLIYTPDERRRRDASRWTTVQGVLAPLQFLVFFISFGLILRYLATGEGLAIATASIVAKTLVLYAIMVTGSIWEREVFGKYLFAPSFFWEDVFSMLVLALHTAYLVALVTQSLTAYEQMLLALAAYSAYVINAGQFVLKLRAARLEQGVAASARQRYGVGA
jgi:3-vinyl bacteriochlorophyllide hydratase